MPPGQSVSWTVGKEGISPREVDQGIKGGPFAITVVLIINGFSDNLQGHQVVVGAN